MFLVINRSDVNLNITADILRVAAENEIPVLGLIPFDRTVLNATRQGVPVTRMSGAASEAIRQITQNLSQELDLL